ncbi:chorismate mutase [Brachybacterium sp. P6-10-X1]|uniref:chorismate mutase n=1 Tax=Brachybacterium sp. P6-10-X1 TaxID=1903186 RepID=UPI000971BBC2|nr:chorismate mutase [Brachybacterium sp. P6-10-X1]APX34386.1 chorismate mutase [Brachybacterium sp. P6-10-X1]
MAPDRAEDDRGRHDRGDAARARELLAQERRSIDNIDAALVHLLAERFAHTQRVGVLKATHGLPPADPTREQEQIEHLRSLADTAGLDPVFAEAFMRFIVTEVIRHHERIREEGAAGS